MGAAACLRRGMRLAPVALTGPQFAGTAIDVGGVTVHLTDGSDAVLADEVAVAAKKAAEEAEILSEKKSDDSEEDSEDDFSV